MSDLIEQLGGYEKAKQKAENALANQVTRISYKTKLYINGEETEVVTGAYVRDIKKALLEYRREHSIFEVGDKVIGSKLFDDRIFEFQYYLPELSMAVISKDGAAIGLNQLRHATDEEIKAGKRLEVS